MSSSSFPPQLEIEGRNIVIRGDFQPAAYQPSWFAYHGLIRGKEAEEATVNVISSQITVFTMEWLRLEVTQDRLHASTTQAAFYEILRDIIMGMLEKIAENTPLRQLGLNHDFHYKLDSTEKWHKVGNELAPKPVWESIFDQPGLRSISIEGKRPDNRQGYLVAKVEPSQRVEEGVFIHLNDHIQLNSFDKIPESASEAIEILTSSWSSSADTAHALVDGVLELSESENG